MEDRHYLFTSESVSEGHPDKVCDQIADRILDEILVKDKDAYVAIECFVSNNDLIIGGEVYFSKKIEIDYDSIARNTIKDIGYDKDELGFNYSKVNIINLVKEQSSDIRQGVKNIDYHLQGAGDQGIMFGYATDETSGYMPLAITIAHKLVRIATKLRKEGKFKNARPDMKAQVTIDYYKNNKQIDMILMSIQHDPNYNEKEFKEYIIEKIMKPVAISFGLNTDFKVLINPTGKFVIGGPAGDTGLTGRKIIVDTYGGSAHHGGGSFSGKDPSKVDRSAAYMARYIAKNIVASGLCSKIEIEIGYAIGKAEPVSISFDTFNTNKVSNNKIEEVINKLFDCRPGVIIENFKLKEPTFKYSDLSNYGHFGRPDLDLPYEKLDKVDSIKKYLNLD